MCMCTTDLKHILSIGSLPTVKIKKTLPPAYVPTRKNQICPNSVQWPTRQYIAYGQCNSGRVSDMSLGKDKSLMLKPCKADLGESSLPPNKWTELAWRAWRKGDTSCFLGHFRGPESHLCHRAWLALHIRKAHRDGSFSRYKTALSVNCIFYNDSSPESSYGIDNLPFEANQWRQWKHVTLALALPQALFSIDTHVCKNKATKMLLNLNFLTIELGNLSKGTVFIRYRFLTGKCCSCLVFI